uniref:BRO1 domain-containing protein n=2 Tax=Caenorhabditis tropicalis TaxID=1561998 RepID=A0A1I7UHA6_9PELO
MDRIRVKGIIDRNVIFKSMEPLSRYVYEKGSVEMANQLCELKIETFNQLLIDMGELSRILDKKSQKEEKSSPSINNALGLNVLGIDRLCRNVKLVIEKMVAKIDGKSKTEEWKTEQEAMRKEIPLLRRMEKTSAQEEADVRICYIDQLVTGSMEKMTMKVCQKASAGTANRLNEMKIETLHQIFIKRGAVTKAVDKALREGKSIDDAIRLYSKETVILCNKFYDAGLKMLTESEKKKEEKEYMVPIRARIQYASVRTLLSLETALQGDFGKPFYPLKDMSKNRSNIYETLRQRDKDYEEIMMVEEWKTREQVENIMKDDPEANVEPILFEYQQFLFEFVEKAKKEGLEWKRKWDEIGEEKITVEKENEAEKEKKIDEKKVTTKQMNELKAMMTVM